jgi:hypothetical protein
MRERFAWRSPGTPKRVGGLKNKCVLIYEFVYFVVGVVREHWIPE